MSKRAGNITLDPSHLAHSLFELLPSGRCYRALSTRTTRHRNSFFPQAIHLMNTWHQTWNTQHYYTIIYSPHTHIFFSFQICTSDLTHKCLYCILCFCHFVNLYIVLLLSVSCAVAVILLHCGASVIIHSCLSKPVYVSFLCISIIQSIFFMFNIRKKHKVWNNMRVRKWQNFYFCGELFL